MNYPKRGLSIDIGNEKIKIVDYVRNKDTIKIGHSLLLDTPENAISDGVISGVTDIGDVISAALREKGIKTKDVIFTVASSKIITREVDLPDLPVKKLNTLIRMNADEYFPVNLAEYTLDYRIIDRVDHGDGLQAKVNLVAALSTLMDGYVELAESLNLRVRGIDYGGNSIINFASHLDIDDTYMLLDLGSDSTMVTVMSKKVVKFNRNLVYGTKVINNSIQNHFGVDLKEAMKIAAEQSILTYEPETNDFLSNDVSSALNQILNGVSRLMDYYASRNKDSIEHIYIVGGGTGINGIAAYIERYFNMTCTILSENPRVVASDDSYVKNSVYYANAIGAIYSEMNLLPIHVLNKDKLKVSKRLKIELALLAFALVAVAVYLPYMGLRNLEKEKESLLAEIEEKQIAEVVLEDYNRTMTSLAFHESIMTTSSSSTEIMADLLEKMEAEIPTSVSYLTMNNSEEGILISCIASDKLTMVNFITILKNMTLNDEPVFSQVYVPSFNEVEGSTAGNSYYAFSIACDYVVQEVAQ
ncbi:MAG: pilus assembly protein PilM [Vallitaleaceae bacterium]|nr:pilus assembly protein PilM [Vallitaleaceae bacterium]